MIRSILAMLALIATVSCAAPSDDAPPVAAPAVVLTPSQAAVGTPVEVRYRFEPLPGVAMPAGRQLVFVHAVGASGQLLWTDDHEPPEPVERWQPGTPIEYTRTMFVPRVEVAGPVEIRVGVYSAATGARVSLKGTSAGGRAYTVATLDVRPDPSAIFVAFGDGWYNPETGETLGREWRWSGQVGRLLFRNPKRATELWLELDQPVSTVASPQAVELRIAGRVVDSFTLEGQAILVRRTSLTPEAMGTSETVELEVVPSQTFVPAAIPALKNTDRRELGVRVFNAYLASR